jgi:hypothetical protein
VLWAIYLFATMGPWERRAVIHSIPTKTRHSGRLQLTCTADFVPYPRRAMEIDTCPGSGGGRNWGVASVELGRGANRRRSGLTFPAVCYSTRRDLTASV